MHNSTFNNAFSVYVI